MIQSFRYKSEHTPSADEITRLALKYDNKLEEDSIARILEGESAPVAGEQPRRRKPKGSLLSFV
jgi:hypothetical protein